jgi:tetratricopeptide (TPR) repeat protein
MTEFAMSAKCASCSGQLPAYVSYILQGVQLSGCREVEEHLACCPACAWEYAELLGMALQEKIEPLLDLLLEDGAETVSTGLLIGYNQHWLELCNFLADQAGAAAALSHLGILHELGGDYDQAVDFYRKALQQAAQLAGSHYARLHSAAGLGRLYRGRGQWDEALNHLQVCRQAASVMNDQYGLTRSFIELGDYYSRPRSYTALARAVKYYDRAVAAGDRAGYARGREIAQKRLTRLKSDLGLFFRKLTEQYVQRYYDQELQLLDRFCSDFAARLIDEMVCSDGGNSMQAFSLGQSFSGARTPDILRTSLSSFLEQGVSWDSFQGMEEDTAAPLLSEEALSKLVRDVQGMGLPQQEAEELARCLQEALAREIAAETGFISKEQ